MLLRVPTTRGEDQTLNRVGVCRQKSATRTYKRPDKTVSAWVDIMWRDGDRQVDIASWNGRSLTLSSAEADSCFFGAYVTQECINRVLPADILEAAQSEAGTGKAIASPIGPSSQGQSTQTLRLAKAYQLLSENQIDTALAEFDRALMAEPNNALAYTGRGYGLALKGKLENAMADLDRAVQLNARSAHAFSYRGFVFLLRREPDRAIAQLDQALVLDPKLSQAYAFRGDAYLAKGDTERALSDLNKSIEIMPKFSSALGTRGQVHASRKEHRKAVDDYTAAMDLSPNSVLFHVRRGQSLEALGRPDEATNDYSAAVALRPNTFHDVALHVLAKQRLDALAGAGSASADRACPTGQECL